MSLIEYLSAPNPMTNIPELLNLYHNNPLGISPIAQLVFIFMLAVVMHVVNYLIRRRDQSQLYPILYTLFGFSLAAIYYYCFQADLPSLSDGPWAGPCIGWFCHASVVGVGWMITGLTGLVIVLYSLLCALMQITAEMSVHAGLSEGKKWKEWKWATVLAFACVAVCGYVYFTFTKNSSWVLFISQMLIILFILVKMIADCIRANNVFRAIAISLVFYVGLIAVFMLSIECMYGALLFFLAILCLLATVKASKKKPKVKVTEE